MPSSGTLYLICIRNKLELWGPMAPHPKVRSELDQFYFKILVLLNNQCKLHPSMISGSLRNVDPRGFSFFIYLSDRIITSVLLLCNFCLWMQCIYNNRREFVVLRFCLITVVSDLIIS